MTTFTEPPYPWQMPPRNVLRSRWAWGAAAFFFTCLILVNSNRASVVASHELGNTRVRKGDNLYDVRNRTLGFERVFAISLPTRTDQHDQLILAGRVTDVDVEIAEGVWGRDMEHKAVPLQASDREKPFNEGAMGAWRAHINVLQKIVRDNIQSALILEGDADWDMRLKEQLVQFAKASRILLQPGVGTKRSIDPSNPMPKPDDIPVDFALDESYSRVELSGNSPYGDVEKWDVLWLGHCGTRWPQQGDNIALGRVIISDDMSVPQPRWFDTQFGSKDIKLMYPNHTRVVHHAQGSVCTLGYAITQKAAQKLLYELGIKIVNGAMDIMLRDMCAGTRGRPKLNCLSVQPQLMHTHYTNGINSDISGKASSHLQKAYTKNIRFSTRINLPQIIYGWDNFTEQWSNEEPGP